MFRYCFLMRQEWQPKCLVTGQQIARSTSSTETNSSFGSGSKMPEPLNAEQCRMRDRFWEKEKEWEAQIDYSRLSSEEIAIVQCHREAVQKGHFTYDDPKTGYKVFTRLRHSLKGSCCGKACRHCVYDHVSVPEEEKGKAAFNTAFWVPLNDPDEPDEPPTPKIKRKKL